MKGKNISYYFLTCLPALLFLSVFAGFGNLMNGWSVSRVLYIICLAAAMSLVAAGILILQNRSRITMELTLLDEFVLLLAGYIFVRGLFTAHFSLLNPYFVTIDVLTGVYFYLRTLLRKEFESQNLRIFYVLMAAFLGAGLVQAGYGLAQLYGVFPSRNPNFKITGSFLNPDYFAGYLAIIMPVAASLYLYSGRKRFPEAIKYLSAITFIGGLLVLPITYDRGAWLAATAGIGFVVAGYYRLFARFVEVMDTTTKKVAFGILGLSLLAGLGAGLYLVKPNSAYGRLFIWKITTRRMVPAHPVFGAGFNRFKAIYNNEQAAYFASGAGNAHEKWVAGNVHQAHNEYLQIQADLGVAGLILFGGIVVGLLADYKQWLKGRSQNAWLRQIVIGALLSVSILAFFAFPFHILPTAVNIVFLGACCSALAPPVFQTTFPIGNKSLRFGMAGILIFTTACALYYSQRKYHQYKQWQRAVQVGFVGQQKKADSLFSHLYPRFQNNGRFLFTYGSYEARAGECRRALPLLKEARATYAGPHLYLLLGRCYRKTGQFIKAEKNIQHAAWIRPSKMYPPYLLAKLYEQAGKFRQAVQTARQVLQMKGKKATTAGRQIKKNMQALIETADRSKNNNP